CGSVQEVFRSSPFAVYAHIAFANPSPYVSLILVCSSLCAVQSQCSSVQFQSAIRRLRVGPDCVSLFAVRRLCSQRICEPVTLCRSYLGLQIAVRSSAPVQYSPSAVQFSSSSQFVDCGAVYAHLA